MQRNVFQLSQDQYTQTGGKVTALACSLTTTSSGPEGIEGEDFGGSPRQDGYKNTNQTIHQLLVGLATGHVEEYRFDTSQQQATAGFSGGFTNSGGTGGPQLNLFRSENVSKKAIDQLCIVSSGYSKVLCALAGNQLWIIKDQKAAEEGQKTVVQVKESSLKGVFFIAQDLCNIGCRNLLALCRTSLAPGLPKKLKLVFMEVSTRDQDLHVLHEQVLDVNKEVISSSTQVKEAVWFGDSLLLRTDKNYVHLSLSTLAAKEIFAHSNGEKENEVCAHQYMIPIVEKNLTLLLTEDIGTIVNMMGEPTGSMVQFPIEPIAIHAMCFPYLLAVFAKSVYVYDIRKDLKDAHVQTIPFSNYFLSPSKVDQVPVTSWTSVTPSGENQIYVMVGHNDMLLFLSQTPLEEQCKEMLRAHKFDECLQIAHTSQLPEYREYLIENSCAEAAFQLIQELDVERALDFLGKCKDFQPSQLFPLFPEYTKPWKTQVMRKRYWSMHPPLLSLDELIKDNESSHKNQEQKEEKEVKRAVVAFLLNMRKNKGGKEENVLLGDGVDTLVVHLLLDVEDIVSLEALAKSPNRVAISQVEAKLCSVGRIHALALLHESNQQYHEAAELWISLCEKQRIELPSVGAFLTTEELVVNEGGEPPPAGAGKKTLLEVISLELARVMKKGGSQSSVVAAFLPWLMERSVDVSLKLLSKLSLNVEEIMNMLAQTRTNFRWKYLDFVVNTEESTNPMHHSEFAIAMIDLWKLHQQTGSEGVDLDDVRSRLQAFLEDSDYYNAQTVILALKGTALWAEQVIVNKKIGNHKDALAMLTFTMRDRERAVSYCEQLGTQEGYLTLLDMLLNPEEGPPLYGDAVRLLGSKGASLNPLRVLEALSDQMPLPLAYETLARMLRERTHRKRSGQILKGLSRAHELSIAQERVLSLSEHIEMTADRACRVCNVRIGTKVFGLYPNGVLVCYRCLMKQGQQHICPVTGRNFKKE